MRTASSRLMLLAASCLVVAGVWPDGAYAKTITAVSLAPQAVWKAIDVAKNGDTVQLPAGRADWTEGWNSHGARMKAIIIQGAGMDKTLIRDHRSGKWQPPLFVLKGVEGKPFRVTGITFDGTAFAGVGYSGEMMSISGTCKKYRIDHCKFRNADHMLRISGDTYGLIDHCRFEADMSHGGNVQPVDFSGPGRANYDKPLSLGTAQATYFEDNEVYIARSAGRGGKRSGNNPWIAPNNGARIVIRHNKIVDAELEIYRPGRNGQYGCQQVEIYDNQFSTVDDVGQIIIAIGAGIAIVFDNTATGTHYWRPAAITLRNERAWRNLPGFPKADGKVPMDGNQIPAGQPGAGYPCFGQVGWATNVGGKFKLTPCYAWGNTLNGKPLLMEVDPRAKANEAATIKEGREFFNEKPPQSYYKPYVYPHPLQKGWKALMKSVAAHDAASGSPAAAPPAREP
jgi:hypothetical protein